MTPALILVLFIAAVGTDIIRIVLREKGHRRAEIVLTFVNAAVYGSWAAIGFRLGNPIVGIFGLVMVLIRLTGLSPSRD